MPDPFSTRPSPSRGTYALVLRSDSSESIEIGRWGRLNLRRGYYVYVGSALGPGGLRARVSRHCREEKKKHWHIDYLREFANLASVWYSHSPDRLEHRWAQALAGMNEMKPVKGFGCSDCTCESHLFFVTRKPALGRFANAVRGLVKSWACEKDG